ncbi:Clp protease N-terminal domain-containing protein [Micromonospora sp. NPDC050200]|uniref:Clp protease N-terminal domain-containing protein n=1 Tax=Micromonospora sp. NPDC050200 TaxID=3155664 RepID=UPI0033DC7368
MSADVPAGVALGLLREGGGLAALVLTEAGLSLGDLRRRVETALRTAARPVAGGAREAARAPIGGVRLHT